MRRLKLLAPFALIAAGLLAAALSLAATKFPSVVLSRASLAAYTSTVASSLSTAQVVELGHFGFWRYSASSNATPDGVNVIEPSDSPASGRWLLQSGVIAGTVSYSVCASGCNFTTIPPLSNFSAQTLGMGAELRFSVSAGAYNFTSPILTQPGEYVSIAGAATTAHTVTSIASCSGSAGAYSCVLQMGESVSNITANQDYVLITAAAGGANPTRLDGLMPVTAVNTGSSQITVIDPNLASAAPSGAVTATATDISTIFEFANSDGIDDWNHHTAVVISNIVLVGDGSAHTGLSIQDTDRLLVQGPTGVYGFGTGGLYTVLASEVNGSSPIALSANGIGIHSDTSSVIDEPACWLNGNIGQGILAAQSATVRCTAGVITGNGSDGVSAGTWANVNVTAVAANDNGGYGYNITSTAFLNNGSASGNASGSANSEFVLPVNFLQTTTVNGNSDTVEIGARTDEIFHLTSSGTDKFAIFGSGNLTTGNTINVGTVGGGQVFRDGSNNLLIKTSSGYGLLLQGSSGTQIGTPTGGGKGTGTLNVQGALYANGTAGVTCSGAPTASFATVGGIVTHC